MVSVSSAARCLTRVPGIWELVGHRCALVTWRRDALRGILAGDSVECMRVGGEAWTVFSWEYVAMFTLGIRARRTGGPFRSEARCVSLGQMLLRLSKDRQRGVHVSKLSSIACRQ